MSSSSSRIVVQPFENFQIRYERKGRFKTAQTGSSSIQIWKCIDKKTYEQFSLKVMKKTLKAKFEREVSILKECNGHPNLLHIRNVYECPKYLYIVFDNCQHPNVLQALAQLEASGDKVGPPRVAAIVAALLSALSYLHDPQRHSKQNKVEIILGNLQPKNILVPDPNRLSSLTIVGLDSAQMNLGQGKSKKEQEESSDSSDEEKDEPGKKPTTQAKKSPFYPPEFAQTKSFSTKGDMWALGVLTFLLLTGKYPFDKPSAMMHPVQKWYGIKDPSCKAFIQALLQPDPNQRASAKDINTPDAWFSSVAEFALNQWDFSEVMNRLGMISREHDFQVAVRSYISTSVLQKSERAHLDQIFRVADGNNSGTLTKEEFDKAMLQADPFIDQQSLQHYFELLDTGGHGEITYSEFMAFAEDKEKLFEKKKLRAAFDAFDYSKTGYITAMDLKNFSRSAGGSAAFRGEKTLRKSMIKDMIQHADKDGDGKISFDEFVDMMLGTNTVRAAANRARYESNSEEMKQKAAKGKDEIARLDEIEKRLARGML